MEAAAKKQRRMRRIRLLKAKVLSKRTAVAAVWSLARFLLLVGLSFVIVYPFLVKISASFMSRNDLLDPTVWLIPRSPTLDNIQLVLTYGEYWKALVNTLLISLMCGVLQTLVCAMVGYGFARFKFRGGTLFFMIAVLTIIIPPQVIYTSLYMKFRYFDMFGIVSLLTGQPLNMVGSPLPMAVLSATGLGLKNGLYIFVMRQFYKGVPKELSEAAMVDGSGQIRTYFQIMLPLSTPMMLSIFILSFAWQWTDTFYSDLFFKSMTVLPNIPSLVSRIASEGIMAETMLASTMINTAVILILVPLFLFFLVAQRYLIQGIERSGIVG